MPIMKKKARIIGLIVLLISYSGLSRAEEINEDWIKMDSIFINLLKYSYSTNPISIKKHLEPIENKRVNLGFGFSSIEHSMGKGYISIFYTFIYKDKNLVSFRLSPQMPDDSRLTNRYLAFYEGMFAIENYQPQNLNYGYEFVSKPLKDAEIKFQVSNQVKFFMTPYSGIIYGDFGGIANEVLENRSAFNIVKSSVNEDLLIYLLKSINPATRLCAAELYNTQKDSFKRNELIEKLIETNLIELPAILTMSGCIEYSDDARKVLNQMIDKNK
jgi:hypothetical protein